MERILINSIKRERDSELATTGDFIVGEMDGNPNFLEPPPALAAAKKLLPEYHIALADAKGRNPVKVSLKKDFKAKLVALLTELAAYVTLTCNGDRTKLLSSGFPISGEKGEEAMPAIQKLDVELGTPGEVTTKVKRVAGARAYMHQYTTEQPSSNTVWISEGTTNAVYTFKGLQSSVKYWFRVVAIGKNGQMVYSPIMSRIMQ